MFPRQDKNFTVDQWSDLLPVCSDPDAKILTTKFRLMIESGAKLGVFVDKNVVPRRPRELPANMYGFLRRKGPQKSPSDVCERAGTY